MCPFYDDETGMCSRGNDICIDYPELYLDCYVYQEGGER
jgi:hypothetical protein